MINFISDILKKRYILLAIIEILKWKISVLPFILFFTLQFFADNFT